MYLLATEKKENKYTNRKTKKAKSKSGFAVSCTHIIIKYIQSQLSAIAEFTGFNPPTEVLQQQIKKTGPLKCAKEASNDKTNDNLH